jgi:hypothetical protein
VSGGDSLSIYFSPPFQGGWHAKRDGVVRHI